MRSNIIMSTRILQQCSFLTPRSRNLDTEIAPLAKMRVLCARMLLCLASCSGLRLDAWSQLPDGRVTGTLGDRTVWLNLASRSRAAAAGAHAGEVCRG